MAEGDICFIKLQGAENSSLWKYFAFKLTDGKTIGDAGKAKPNVCDRMFKTGNTVLR